jgi:hypothetical protein
MRTANVRALPVIVVKCASFPKALCRRRGRHDMVAAKAVRQVKSTIEVPMRARLMLLVLPLLLGGWFDDPPAWMRPDGRPIDPVPFQRERTTCAGRASIYTGHEDLWIAAFSDCMLHFGYLPLRRDILP